MATNSYRFSGKFPENAKFGVYDNENGIWTGQFFGDRPSAQEWANAHRDEEVLTVCSIADLADVL
jgi:hypothetical protein